MTFALGREEKLYVVPESTYGAAAANAAATNALRYLECSFSQTVERVMREDKRATRSLMQQLQRRKSVEWNMTSYLLPSGALGTAPDGHDDILEALFGTETISGGASVTYSLAKEFFKSLTFHRAFGHAAASMVSGEIIRGAVPVEATFMLSGQDEAKVSYSGFASDILRAGFTEVVADDGDDVEVTAGHAQYFDVGMYVNIGAVLGLVVLAVDYANDVLTVTNHAATSVGDDVIPSSVALDQTFVSTANPISGVLGSVDLDSASFNIITAEINLNNGTTPHNDGYGFDKTTNGHHGNRSVSGNIVIRLDHTNFRDIARARSIESRALEIVAGTAAGSTATFTLPNVQFDYTAVNASGPEDILVTLPFKALGDSGEDEIELVLE